MIHRGETKITYLLILVAVVLVFWPQEVGYRDKMRTMGCGWAVRMNIPGNNSWMLGRVN